MSATLSSFCSPTARIIKAYYPILITAHSSPPHRFSAHVLACAVFNFLGLGLNDRRICQERVQRRLAGRPQTEVLLLLRFSQPQTAKRGKKMKLIAVWESFGLRS